MNINDVGYNVTIGEPVVDAKGVADSGLSFPCKAIPDGDYLVTLEVNGTVIAGRDKAAFASGSATVGDYTLSYSSYAVSVATLTDDDVVVLRIEPLEVKVSDAFRAVVGKAAPAGGDSGGSSDEPLIGERTFTQVLGDPTSEGSGFVKTYFYELDDGIEGYLEYDEALDDGMYKPKQNCAYTIGGVAQIEGFFKKKDDGKFYYCVFVAKIAGDRTFVMTETTYSPALINLYDPNSSDTDTYYPDGAYDSDAGAFVLDVSAAYERLKRGQNVWIRHYDSRVLVELVVSYGVAYGNLFCQTFFSNGEWLFTNYTGTSDDSGTENDQPPISPVSPNNPI